jgi:hypothetical protein
MVAGMLLRRDLTAMAKNRLGAEQAVEDGFGNDL